MHKKAVLFLICLLTAASLCAQNTRSQFDGKTWWSYVKVLADDKMQGRDTGSPGLRKAESFIVDQLK